MPSEPEPDAVAERLAQERCLDPFDGTAYVLPITDEGEVCYGIFAADGTPLAVAPTRALALAVIRKYDMRPADAH